VPQGPQGPSGRQADRSAPDFPIKQRAHNSDPYWLYSDIANMLRIFLKDVRYHKSRAANPFARQSKFDRMETDLASAGLFLVPVTRDTASNTYKWNQSTQPIDMYGIHRATLVRPPAAEHSYLMLVDGGEIYALYEMGICDDLSFPKFRWKQPWSGSMTDASFGKPKHPIRTLNHQKIIGMSETSSLDM
jgi:hypothetical protein